MMRTFTVVLVATAKSQARRTDTLIGTVCVPAASIKTGVEPSLTLVNIWR